VAEPPALAAGSGEARLLGRDREIAGGYELATGGSGKALHLRYDRLRQVPNCQHQLGAGGEQPAHTGEVAVDHIGEIMPRAEDRTVRSQDHRTRIRLVSRTAERRDQFPHMRLGKCVAPLRAVHGDGRDPGRGSDLYVLVADGISRSRVHRESFLVMGESEGYAGLRSR
jgi:hypothetical protein